MLLFRKVAPLAPQCGTCTPTWSRKAVTRGVLIAARRSFSCSPISFKPVDLASDVYSPKTKPDLARGPLVVLHGLYGSKQNWRSQAKGIAQHLGRDVITLVSLGYPWLRWRKINKVTDELTELYCQDLRNHGLSPHAPEAAYSDLAGDVRKFIDDHKLQNICLVGHSMGGKVAMALTLEPHEQIKQLVVVDIAPGIGAISPEFRAYLTAMKEIDDAKVMSRKEADAILTKIEPDLGVRQFLLTNLIRCSDSSPYTFRLPLDYLSKQIDEIGSFPFPPGTKEWTGPTLFLKGAKSKYVNRRNIPLCEGYFPKMELKTLETGHWVHAEKPKEFLQALEEFLDHNP